MLRLYYKNSSHFGFGPCSLCPHAYTLGLEQVAPMDMEVGRAGSLITFIHLLPTELKVLSVVIRVDQAIQQQNNDLTQKMNYPFQILRKFEKAVHPKIVPAKQISETIRLL